MHWLRSCRPGPRSPAVCVPLHTSVVVGYPKLYPLHSSAPYALCTSAHTLAVLPDAAAQAPPVLPRAHNRLPLAGLLQLHACAAQGRMRAVGQMGARLLPHMSAFPLALAPKPLGCSTPVSRDVCPPLHDKYS